MGRPNIFGHRVSFLDWYNAVVRPEHPISSQAIVHLTRQSILDEFVEMRRATRDWESEGGSCA